MIFDTRKYVFLFLRKHSDTFITSMSEIFFFRYICSRMKENSSLVKWIILVVLSITWGSSFILMKWALPYYSSLEIGSLRILFAALALSPLLFRSLRVIRKHHWKYLVLFGLIGNTLPAILFATAQQYISSSYAGVLNSTTPFFTLLVGLVLYKQTTRWWNVSGIIIGFIGTILIINSTQDIDMSTNFTYTSLILLATLFYAFNVNMLKYNLSDLKSGQITSVGFALMFIPLLLFLFLATDFTQTIQQPESRSALLYPVILGVLGSGGAVLLFNQLIKMSSPLFASSVTYLIPVVALILGVLDGENFPLINLVWITLVLTGVFLVNRKPKQV